MMRSLAKDPSPVSFSLSLYQLLLMTYPAGFRREYGSHMAQVFRDYCLRVYRLEGPPGMLRLWILTLLDYFKSVVEEHLQQGVHMSKSKFIRLSGWSFILGALAFSIVMISFARRAPEYSPYNALSQPIDLYFEYAVAILLPSSGFLWLVGTIGLYLRFSEELNLFGKFSLIMGMIGAGISFLITLAWSFQLELTASDVDFGFFVAGLSLFSIGVVLFGIVSIREHLLPRWNVLPIIAGSWVLILWLLNIPGLGGYIEGSGENILFVLSMFSMLGLAVLGYTLGEDSQELASTP
jgi:hypothetical protein